MISGTLGTSSMPLETGGVSDSGGVTSGSEGFDLGSSSSGSVDSMKLTSNYSNDIILYSSPCYKTRHTHILVHVHVHVLMHVHVHVHVYIVGVLPCPHRIQ